MLIKEIKNKGFHPNNIGENVRKKIKLLLNFFSLLVNFLKQHGGAFARVFSPHSVLCHVAEWSGCSWHCSSQKKQLCGPALCWQPQEMGVIFPQHAPCFLWKGFSFVLPLEHPFQPKSTVGIFATEQLWFLPGQPKITKATHKNL